MTTPTAIPSKTDVLFTDPNEFLAYAALRCNENHLIDVVVRGMTILRPAQPSVRGIKSIEFSVAGRVGSDRRRFVYVEHYDPLDGEQDEVVVGAQTAPERSLLTLIKHLGLPFSYSFLGSAMLVDGRPRLRTP